MNIYMQSIKGSVHKLVMINKEKKKKENLSYRRMKNSTTNGCIYPSGGSMIFNLKFKKII